MELNLEALPNYWSLPPTASTHFQRGRSLFIQYRNRQFSSCNNGKRFDFSDKSLKTKFFVQKENKKNHVTVGCNCKQFDATEPCAHIWGLLIMVGEWRGKYYFNQFDDFTAEKSAILAEFGFTSEDEVAKEFVFGIDERTGLFVLKQTPGELLPNFTTESQEWTSIIKKMPAIKIKSKSIADAQPLITAKNSKEKTPEPFDLAILINLNDTAHQGFRIDAFKITQKGNTVSYTIHRLKTKENVAIFNAAPLPLQNALLALTDENLVAQIKINNYDYNISESQPFRNLNEQQIQLINSEYQKAITQILPYLIQWQHVYYLANGLAFAKTNVKPCKFANDILVHKIILKQTIKTIGLEVVLYSKATNETITNYTIHKFFIKHNDIFYPLPAKFDTINQYIPKQKLLAPINAKSAFIHQIVLPLSAIFEIDMNNVVKETTIAPQTQPRIYLSELNEKYLILTPKWQYDIYEIDNDNDEKTILELEDGTLLYIQRNTENEQQFVQQLRQLHPMFERQNNEYFYLPFDEVMKKNWFFTMYQQLQELEIPVFGMNNLKRFKYNTNKPTMQLKTSSGTDWFDINIAIQYGDQTVPLAALRKAIINKQQFILLTDGTLGILPDEWIKKFATLMRMGMVKEGNMQVSKLHWTLIDQLHDEIDEEAVFNEILAKKEKLKSIEDVQKVKIPTNIKATLRNYQKSGFQWMNMLDEMGWGGCLADDMGLGKTLQTLTFLSGIQKKYKGETHLIVCPTSLIYNWESEIQKFTPHLQHFIYYGVERTMSEHDLYNADIVITSYGTIRSDIEAFLEFKFGYVILDESQAIKNHLSQTAKAVQLLKSRNRLILSGTPVQNNTFDLYAQFNFINQGLLGNMEFFKTEFANPIDKENDKGKTDLLRKLIYPFMLRRTKEQVAKDLPAKTETILWCEMEGKQRTIYNSFRDDYRKTIMEKIETEGFAKASLFILSGLTKLRQICDSPAILNEAEAYPNVSVKIDELLREINENASNHKALIFSQFTSMLNLIATELDKRKIPYYYLDGTTKATDRKRAVENFQQNNEVKLFLISLKAGGVGLNLTSADYVYLIDPWWNPAAEQQAIDRTHRIGQTKFVFAYKLICKDSIEEKILQLQQRKKALSADLISDENGFVKKLTKDDVAYLFS